MHIFNVQHLYNSNLIHLLYLHKAFVFHEHQYTSDDLHDTERFRWKSIHIFKEWMLIKYYFIFNLTLPRISAQSTYPVENKEEKYDLKLKLLHVINFNI